MKSNFNKKIIYLGYNSFYLHKRGVENVILFQANANDWDKIYIHFGDNTNVYRYENFICISIKKIFLFSYFILNLVVFKLYLKYRFKILIHSHNPIFTSFLFKKTNVLTVHDSLYHVSKQRGCNLVYLIAFYLFEKIAYYKSENIQFISNYTKKTSLITKYLNNKCVLIYNTTPFEKKAFAKSNKNIVDNFYNVHNSFFLIVRSIEIRAKIDLLIDVSKEFPDELFIVAGKGPLLNFYRDEIQKNNIENVKLLGFVNDVDLVELYKNCKCVIMPAEFGEGFGLPIIEGYLFNKPVIASNRCAIPEVIFDDSYLFENNLLSLKKAILSIKTDYSNKYNEYYMDNFSFNIIISKYSNLYNKCI